MGSTDFSTKAKRSRITPNEFFARFHEVVCELRHLLQDEWFQHREFTRYMRTEVFRQVADKLRLNYYDSDYYTLDGVMYDEADDIHFGPRVTYVKSIAVALEHENDPRSCTIEMNKLQLFNAPLKVLVTYPRNDEEAKRILEMFEKIISEADTFEDIGTARRQLLIFGFKGEMAPEWRGFEYEGGSFKRLTSALPGPAQERPVDII